MGTFVISNVDVVDGRGTPAFRADVTVDGSRIGSVDDPSGGTGQVDGTGLTLAPGFIDVHTHDDWTVLADPNHACKTLQGVTSVVVGNCGSSCFPASGDSKGRPEFDSLGGYFELLESQGAAVNVGALAGHGTIRTSVMGLVSDRGPTAAEQSRMEHVVEQAMEDGAIGLSSGLAYEPGKYSAPDELVALNRIVAAAGGIYTTHMRNESDDLIASIDESIDVAEAAGVALQISHIKAAGAANWGLVAEALHRIDRARDRGVDVMADQYPYTRGSTLLEQVVRSGALVGPSAFGQVTPEQVLIAAAPLHPHWEGHTLAELAVAEGIDPIAMAQRIVDAEGRTCFVVIDIMSEADVREAMTHPAVMIGSDGIPAGSKPHPRLGHTYPRILARYVRDAGLLPLEDAVRRMTSMPAERFGFVDRGVIEPGRFADLVLFDAAAVLDTGTYAHPTATPEGIAGVWTNGARVVEAGSATGAHPGVVVKGRA